MKTFGILILLVLFMGTVFWLGSRDNRPVPSQEDIALVDTDNITGEEFPVILEESRIVWTGRRNLIPGYKDQGSIPLKDGKIVIDNDALVGGEFVFDMKEIVAENTANTKLGVDILTKHLRSEDFFDVEKYPDAYFSITKVEKRSDLSVENANNLITGKLTIKDVTAPISFPALVAFDDDGNMKIEAMFDMDRTIWNVRYGSGSFFKNLGDSVIDDMVTMNISVISNINKDNQ